MWELTKLHWERDQGTAQFVAVNYIEKLRGRTDISSILKCNNNQLPFQSLAGSGPNYLIITLASVTLYVTMTI